MKFPSVLSVLLLSASPAAAFDPGNPAASGYSLALSDNFSTLNWALWEPDWWYAHEDACQKAYLPSTLAATAAGLDLHVESLETVAACAGSKQIYSAAHLDSYGHFAQAEGYFEARLKASGAGGTLTAFWLLPASGKWPPEIDVEEIRGDYPKLAYLTSHFGKQNKQTQYVYTAPASLGDDFHTYGALVTAATITWYVDGVVRGQTLRRAGEGARLFPIFSLYTGNCGDGWAGCPGQTTGWSADATVQWIQIWRAPA